MHRRAFSSASCRRGTHYDTLGVKPLASPAQIKTAFFALSKEHHPDIPHHKEKPQFHEITEAYNVLRDPVSRRAYDNTLPAQKAPPPSTPHSRHMADTAARLRRAQSRSQHASSSHSHSHSHPSSPSGPHFASPLETPFARWPGSYTPPLPGANDIYQRHPRQRHRPPDPVAQDAAWRAKKEMLWERKTRGPRFISSMLLGFSVVVTLGWVFGRVPDR
ncbi:DnaJ domain-containing protein [Mycena filopes]|nr:DnaJ domain-containing protein [Mycena filopes]